MNETETKIRIMQKVETDDGFLFWPGETFLACSSVSAEGVEVKAAGEYVTVPAGSFVVV